MDTAVLQPHHSKAGRLVHRPWAGATPSICWLLATASAFWWFQLRNLQPFNPISHSQTVLFEAEQITATLSALLGVHTAPDPANRNAVAAVVHFWDPPCPCNRVNEGHVRKIVADYRSNRHGR